MLGLTQPGSSLVRLHLATNLSDDGPDARRAVSHVFDFCKLAIRQKGFRSASQRDQPGGC